MSFKYIDFVDHVSQVYKAHVDLIMTEYRFDAGPEFEVAVCSALEAFLPARAGVVRGFIVDEKDTVIGDDVIIYDKSVFPTLRSLSQVERLALKQRVPAEAVLAYIELKNTLRIPAKDSDKDDDEKNTFKRAVDQVARVHKLKRSPVPAEALPSYRRPPGWGSSDRGWPEIANPWFTVVMGRKLECLGNPAKVLRDEVKRIEKTNTPLPDLIVAERNVILPAHLSLDTNKCETRIFRTPSTLFNLPAGPTDAAFGLGLLQLLCAIDLITLGPIQWNSLLHKVIEREWPKHQKSTTGRLLELGSIVDLADAANRQR